MQMDRRSQIKKLFEGKLTQEEAKELLEWLHSPEGDTDSAGEIYQIWEDSTETGEHSGSNVDSLWQKINANDYNHRHAEVRISTSKPAKIIPLWLKVACAILLIGVGLSIVLRPPYPVEDTFSSLPEKIEMVTKYNPPGQKTKVFMADGSTVFLNSDSKIEYPVDFVENRQISLDGEAFFTVNK